MSTIKSSAENLTLNADGANNDVIIQSNGSTKVTVDGATGNVGLGVASAYNPASGRKALTVEGTSTALIEMAVNGARTGYIYHNATNLYLATEVSGGNVILAPHASGDVNITNSDIIFDTAGKGIVLGATSNVDANTLSDYEEGTFTAATAGSTYTKNTGYYRKVGSLVYIQLWVVVNTRSSGSRVEISGLPFTSINISSGDGHFPISATRFSSLHTAVTALYPMVINNSTGIKCDALTGTANAGITSNVEIFDSGAAIYFGGCYIAA